MNFIELRPHQHKDKTSYVCRQRVIPVSIQANIFFAPQYLNLKYLTHEISHIND